jgi:hypothetical protein
MGDHGSARARQALRAKHVPSKQFEPVACRRKNPQFIDQVSQLDAASAHPRALLTSRHEIRVIVECLEVRAVLVERTKLPHDQQVEFTLVEPPLQ